MRRGARVLCRVLLLCAVFSSVVPHPVHAQGVSVDDIMSLMTVEERVGQIFMVDFTGADTSEDSGIAELILDYKVGSILITESGGNFDNHGEQPVAQQVSQLANELQRLAYQASSRTVDGAEVFVPLFIAVEQEGNGYPHSQLRSGFTPVLSNLAIGASWSEENARATGAVVGQELASVGVNMLLGPVVDVLDTPRSGERGDLGVRVYGGSPYWVGKLARSYVRGVHQGSDGRVVTIAKHFPGHGASGRDPESEVATINKTLEEMRVSELVPFAAVTSYRSDDPLGTTDGLLVGHIRCLAFQDNMQFFSDPLTLDEGGLGVAMALPEFANWRSTGLLVADFLGADAIKEHLDAQRAGFPHFRIAREALMAGNDILPLVQFSLSGDWEADALPRMVETIGYFQDRYSSDPAFRPWVDESVKRILQAKLELYGSLFLEEVLVDADTAAAAVGQGAESVRQMADEAVTLLYPHREELPARMPGPPTPEDDILIVQCLAGCYPTEVAAPEALQSTLIRLYGPEGTGQVSPDKVHTVGFGQIAEWLAGSLPAADAGLMEQQFQGAEWIIFAVPEYDPDDFPASGAVKDLLQVGGQYLSGKTVVAIAYDAPYHLDSVDVAKLTAYYAVYGKVGPCVEASFRPLFEMEFAATGAAPVDVPGVDYQLSSALQPAAGQTFGLERLSPPSDQPLYVGGEALVVRTGVILDRNGNIVPDGTKVEFRGGYVGGDVFVEPQVVTDTVSGVAGARFVLDAPAPAGLLQVSAESGEAVSDSLIVRVVLPVTPFPTFTPTATATATPTPTVTPVPPTPTKVVPTSTPPAPPPRPASRPVDWLDFLILAGGTVLGNVFGVRVRRGRRGGWEREVQLILYGVALALVGYIMYGLGLLNPTSIMGLQGAAPRAVLFFLSVLLAFLPSGAVWLRGG
ncbi:MAG: glycoside hydrolase family 3 N-terminal domain-containing protein [Anaerolineae bacterium]